MDILRNIKSLKRQLKRLIDRYRVVISSTELTYSGEAEATTVIIRLSF